MVDPEFALEEHLGQRGDEQDSGGGKQTVAVPALPFKEHACDKSPCR
jgi:hypothetical protein